MNCPYCGKEADALRGIQASNCGAKMIEEWPELNEIARKLYHGNLTGAVKLAHEFYAKHRKLSQYDPSDNDEVEI
jgi:hypothetical protein